MLITWQIRTVVHRSTSRMMPWNFLLSIISIIEIRQLELIGQRAIILSAKLMVIRNAHLLSRRNKKVWSPDGFRWKKRLKFSQSIRNMGIWKRNVGCIFVNIRHWQHVYFMNDAWMKDQLRAKKWKTVKTCIFRESELVKGQGAVSDFLLVNKAQSLCFI